jgi:hypothetical protein
MVLATATVEDFDKFLNTFSTKGLEKRREHGSGGATVFRDPADSNRAWVLFDWDDEGYQRLMSDPDMPGIFQEAGRSSPGRGVFQHRRHDHVPGSRRWVLVAMPLDHEQFGAWDLVRECLAVWEGEERIVAAVDD